MASIFIKPNSIDSDGSEVHQASPSYLLTFLRWGERDLKDTQGDGLDIRPPLLVINDAVNISVSFQKSSKTGSFSCTLMCGDINYATAIAPGDYVFVNIVDWEKDVIRLYEKSINYQPINTSKDGFKGFFKIMTVTKHLNTGPDGKKMFYCTVTAQAFSELDTTVLYNPLIEGQIKDEAKAFFSALVGDQYSNLLKIDTSCEKIIQILFEILLGQSRRSTNVKGVKYGEVHYLLPQNFGSFLGRRKAAHMNEVFNLLTGVWANRTPPTSASLYKQLSPNFIKINSKDNIYGVKESPTLQGNRLLTVENWNQKTVWSILNDNLNSALNEMFVAFKFDPQSDSIIPTITVRQKPFNNPDYKPDEGYPVTNFLSLPRWRLSPAMVYSYQLSKNQVLDINFVQVYTRGLAASAAGDLTRQITEENYISNKLSIQRGGQRPYVVSSNFDFPVGGEKRIKAKPWTKIVADWVINGHLKESGVIHCVGLEEPISVGDNLEFDGVVYHIEGVSHHFAVTNDGKKEFKTALSVSYGIEVNSNANQTMFTEMIHTDRQTKNQEDWEYERILPGVGEAQDLPSRDRVLGEEFEETRQKAFMQRNQNRPKVKKPKET
jgi:hypothetical protein